MGREGWSEALDWFKHELNSPQSHGQQERIWRKIQDRLTGTEKRRRRATHFGRITAASVLAGLTLAGSMWWYAHETRQPPGTAHSPKPHPTLPTAPLPQPVRTVLPASQGLAPDTASYWFSNISPDGQWVTYMGNANSWSDAPPMYVRNVRGQTYKVPATSSMYQPNTVYGQTPDGDLILGGSAGSGGVFCVYRPGVGVLKEFDHPGHYVLSADQSTQSHWVEEVITSNGGDPGTKRWTEVDGHAISALQTMYTYQWSPDGVTLAAIVPKTNPGDQRVSMYDIEAPAKIVLYNVATHSVKQVSTPFSYQDYGRAAQHMAIPEGFNGLEWSPDGRYLAWHATDGLHVMDVDTGSESPVAASDATLEWAFAGNDEIIAIPKDDKRLLYYQVTHGQIDKIADRVTPFTMKRYHVLANGYVLVQMDNNELDLWSKTAKEVILNQCPDTWWYNQVDAHVYYPVDSSGDAASDFIWKVPVPLIKGGAGQ